MERVGILVNKLQAQLQQQADIQNMLVTAQMLYTELLHQKSSLNGTPSSSKVSVFAPDNPPLFQGPVLEEETMVVYEKDEKSTPVAAEIVEAEEISVQENVNKVSQEPGRNDEVVVAEAIPALEHHVAEEQKADLPSSFVYGDPIETKPVSRWAFDPVEVPTLAHQERVTYQLKEEVIDDGSLNDKLKEEKLELGNLLKEAPIKDLKRAISINDRHRFIEALFRGDETMYERSIKTINNFSIFAEAEFWIQRELKLKLGWDTNLPEVKVFDQLVRRRFS